MEVHLTPEKEARLQQIAAGAGKDATQVVEEAVDRLLDDDMRFRAEIRKGFASLDRGEFIEEDEMDARVERMIRP